MASSHIVWSFN